MKRVVVKFPNYRYEMRFDTNEETAENVLRQCIEQNSMDIGIDNFVSGTYFVIVDDVPHTIKYTSPRFEEV